MRLLESHSRFSTSITSPFFAENAHWGSDAMSLVATNRTLMAFLSFAADTKSPVIPNLALVRNVQSATKADVSPPASCLATTTLANAYAPRQCHVGKSGTAKTIRRYCRSCRFGKDGQSKS